MVDAFIGSEFEVVNCGLLTVVGKLSPVKDRAQKYSVSCSICSLDKELFPDNFNSTKESLKKGRRCCGCSPSYRYTEEQQKLRVTRLCISKNQNFHGFIGEWKHSQTKLSMSCNVCKYEWGTVNVNSFLSKQVGCPKCGDVRSKAGSLKTTEYSIKEFRSSGKFHEDDTFTRNMVKKCTRGWYGYWDFTCHKCSFDEYVTAGLCSGVWTSSRGGLRQGNLPCRCSEHYRYDQSQRELQLKLLCNNEGIKFEGWVLPEGYVNSHSEFNWVCKQGHKRIATVNGFTGGSRCRACALEGSFNLIKGKESETDICYLLRFECLNTGEVFVKIGRAFPHRYKSRVKELSKYYKVTELATIHDTHENIVALEADYHNYLSKYHYTPKIPFGGSVLECFTIEALDLLDY